MASLASALIGLALAAQANLTKQMRDQVAKQLTGSSTSSPSSTATTSASKPTTTTTTTTTTFSPTRSYSTSSTRTSTQGINKAYQQALDALSKAWFATAQPESRQAYNQTANMLRSYLGLSPGTDYDTTTGTIYNPGRAVSPSGSGLTAVDKAILNALGQAWKETTDPALRAYYNQTANLIRTNAGLRPGIDFDPVTGEVWNEVPREVSEPATPGEAIWNQYQQLLELQNQQQASQQEAILRQFQDFINQMESRYSGLIGSLQEQARRQAEMIARTQLANFQHLIDQLKAQQETGLQAIANTLEDARAAIEDETFRAWLAARQEMANRGLAGSGLASDQDTRLLLQRQRDLAGAFRDANLARYQLENQIRTSLEDLYRQMAAINEDQIYADQFAKLYESALGDITRQQEMYADLFKSILPYIYTPASKVSEQIGSAVDWAELAQKANSDFAKLSLEEQRLALEKARLAIEQEKVDLEYWKALGYIPDPSGSGALVPTAQMSIAQQELALKEAIARGYFIGPNGEIIPTEERRSNEANEYLRAKELEARIRQWAEQNRLDAARIQLSAAQFEHKMMLDQAHLALARDNLALDQDRTQIDWIKANLQDTGDLIKLYLQNGEQPPQELIDKYNTWIETGSRIFTQGQKSTGGGGGGGRANYLAR